MRTKSKGKHLTCAGGDSGASFDQARQAAQRARDLNPDYVPGYLYIAAAALELARYRITHQERAEDPLAVPRLIDTIEEIEPWSTTRRRRIMRSPNRRSLALVPLIFIAGMTPHGTAQPESPAATVTTLLYEDFSSGLAGWTVIDGGTGDGPAPTWTADNPGDRTPPLTAPFAICDSDHHGFGEMDDELISPTVDATGFDPLALSFNHSFRWYSGGWNEVADVDVRSTASGGVWVNVARFDGGDAEGVEVIDLVPWAAADLQVRFHYFNGNWEYWWAVDDVVISGAAVRIFSDGFESGSTSAWGNGAWSGD